MQRQWFTQVELSGYSSHNPSVLKVSHTGVIKETQYKFRVELGLTCAPLYSPSTASHRWFIQTTSQCVMKCSLWQFMNRQHSSDHWINTTPLALKSHRAVTFTGASFRSPQTVQKCVYTMWSEFLSMLSATASVPHKWSGVIACVNWTSDILMNSD